MLLHVDVSHVVKHPCMDHIPVLARSAAHGHTAAVEEFREEVRGPAVAYADPGGPAHSVTLTHEPFRRVTQAHSHVPRPSDSPPHRCLPFHSVGVPSGCLPRPRSPQLGVCNRAFGRPYTRPLAERLQAPGKTAPPCATHVPRSAAWCGYGVPQDFAGPSRADRRIPPCCSGVTQPVRCAYTVELYGRTGAALVLTQPGQDT